MLNRNCDDVVENDAFAALIPQRRARLPCSVKDSGFFVLHIGDPQVDDPIGEVETHEADWKHDARVLVDVGRVHPEELVRVLAGECGLDFGRTSASTRRWSGLRSLRR